MTASAFKLALLAATALGALSTPVLAQTATPQTTAPRPAA
jgi:hypothetical protein